MPTVSKKQQRLMNAVAKDKTVAKKTGVSQKVAKDFVAADKKRGAAELPESAKRAKRLEGKPI